MIDNFIRTKNAKNVAYLDTIKTVATENGFVFNIVLFENKLTNKNFYELRLGYLENENTTPVITLYASENFDNINNYLSMLEFKASEIYNFKKSK